MKLDKETKEAIKERCRNESTGLTPVEFIIKEIKSFIEEKNGTLKKQIKEEVEKQFKKQLEKDYFLIEKKRNGVVITQPSYEGDNPESSVVKIPKEGDYNDDYSDGEKKGLEELVSELIEWLGYSHEKRRMDNPTLRFDLIGYDSDEFDEGKAVKEYIKEQFDKNDMFKQYFKLKEKKDNE